MSTTTTFDIGHIDSTTPARKPGFFDRLIAARMREGKARVSHYLAGQSDRTLRDLGFNADEIAEIRKSGEIPATFWR